MFVHQQAGGIFCVNTKPCYKNDTVLKQEKPNQQTVLQQLLQRTD